MLSKFLFRTKYAFSFNDMKKSFFQFLNLEAGAVYRGAPEFRQRKYLNIEISEKFKELEAKRKQEHLMFAQRRKKLLQQKLSMEAKLLTESQKSELTKLGDEIKSLQTIIEQQNKQLAQIDKNLQQTEAEYILVQGPTKLVVLNTITYLKHINALPSGVVLTPQSTKVIQNVHYLVTHNLPVSRYKLYELMPSMFTREIKQLQQSVQQLIIEKNLNIFEETTSHSIRQFSRHRKQFFDPVDIQLIKMREQRQNIMIDMSEEHMRLLSTHSEYIEKVKKGQTPFRDLMHCFSSLVSPKLNLKLTEQQQALKQTCLTFFKDMSNYEAYCKEWLQKAIQVEYSYVEPPVYVKNHPVLMQLWDKQMELYTNPLFKSDVPNYLPKHEPNDDGRAFMEERIRKEVDKYDEEFARLWNQDKSKLIANKKQIEIEFYNFSTRILEQYSALEDKSKPEIQQFKKLPKRPKRKQQTYARITIDQLTKMLLLNKKDNSKYNLDFFAKYFAMEAPEHKKQLFDMLNSISYLRVFVPEENNQNSTKEVKQEVLKFVG